MPVEKIFRSADFSQLTMQFFFLRKDGALITILDNEDNEKEIAFILTKLDVIEMISVLNELKDVL